MFSDFNKISGCILSATVGIVGYKLYLMMLKIDIKTQNINTNIHEIENKIDELTELINKSNSLIKNREIMDESKNNYNKHIKYMLNEFKAGLD